MLFDYNTPKLNRRVNVDDVFKNFETLFPDTATYPFYNIYSDENNTNIELALAGWKKSELEVYIENNVLFVKGNKQKEDRNYIVKKISQKSFVKTFQIGTNQTIDEVSFSDGMLTIKIKNNVEKSSRQDITIA